MRPLQPATIEEICAHYKASKEITVGAFLLTVRLYNPLFNAMSDAVEQADREDWHDDTLAAVMEGLLMMYNTMQRHRPVPPILKLPTPSGGTAGPGAPIVNRRPESADGPGFMDALHAMAERAALRTERSIADQNAPTTREKRGTQY